jgi:hypothetical protein
MFRTNDSLPAFPWNEGIKEGQGHQQHRARKTCADIFKNNKWDKQVRPLSWLIEHFWEPLQHQKYKNDERDRPWTLEDIAQLKQTEGRFNNQPAAPGSKGILYFTDNTLPLKLARNVQSRIRRIAVDKGLELVSSTRKPMHNMGRNVVVDAPRGYETMFKQILVGLQNMTCEIVFMAEHDVLYPPEHFDFTPPDRKFYYDQNWYKVHSDGLVVSWDADQVSGLCAYRDELIKYYQYRLDTFDKATFDRKFEPFSGEGSASWKAAVPHIDIRHNRNLTYNKRELRHFRKKETAVNFEQTTIENIPGWDAAEIRQVLL